MFKKILKVAGFILLGLVLLVVIARFVVPSVNQYIKTRAAKQKVVEVKLSIEEISDRKFDEKIAALRNAGVIGEQIASSKVDVCYVTHSDRGWLADYWYQDCYIRYVDGYETNLSRALVKQRVLSIPNHEALFGEEDTTAAKYNKCSLFGHLFGQFPDYTVIYKPLDVDPLTDYSCRVPNPLQGLSTVRGPIILDSELSALIDRAYNPNEIYTLGNQIWVMHDEFYYNELLGCGAGLIFCSNPRKTPVQAK